MVKNIEIRPVRPHELCADDKVHALEFSYSNLSTVIHLNDAELSALVKALADYQGSDAEVSPDAYEAESHRRYEQSLTDAYGDL